MRRTGCKRTLRTRSPGHLIRHGAHALNGRTRGPDRTDAINRRWTATPPACRLIALLKLAESLLSVAIDNALAMIVPQWSQVPKFRTASSMGG